MARWQPQSKSRKEATRPAELAVRLAQLSPKSWVRKRSKAQAALQAAAKGGGQGWRGAGRLVAS